VEGWQRLGFAKLSTCMLDLAKLRASRNGGRKARFCQIEHLHARSGQTKGEGGWWQRRGLQAARLGLAKPRMKGGSSCAGRNRAARPVFEKPSTCMLDLAKSRWRGRACVQKRGRQGPVLQNRVPVCSIWQN